MDKRKAGKQEPSKREPSKQEEGKHERRQGRRVARTSSGRAVVGEVGRSAAGASEEPRWTTPAERHDRALALLCQGWRPPAIASALGTTPSTVRRWLRQGFAGIQREARKEYATALLRAVEAQREIAQAAWEAYHHERAVEEAVLRGELDRVKRRAIRRTGTGTGRRGRGRDVAADPANPANPEAPDDGDAVSGIDAEAGEELLIEEVERPRLPAQGARYLALAMAAQREMARLQGLYDELAEPEGHISITITRRPEGPENFPPEERAALIAAGRFGPVPAERPGGADGEATDAEEAGEPDDDREEGGQAADEGEGLP